MWCTCTGKDREEGYVVLDEGEPDSDFPVHAPCRKPSRMVFERTTNMRVPRNAVSVSSVFGRQTGVTEVTFVLRDHSRVMCLYYHPYPMKDVMTEPRDLLIKWWEDLDRSIDTIRCMEGELMESEKARASTLAEVLATIMGQFYEDGKAVLKEAMLRWKARQVGEVRDTPGLAESIWDHNTRWDGTPYSLENEKKARAGIKVTALPKATGNRIPDSAVETARQGISLGMFTIAQMAKTYSMTEDELKDQLGLA